MTSFILLLISAYVIGSVNFSILLFRLVGKEDPRTAYSGNPGVTNVYRQSGLWWASAILVLDISRAMGISFLAASLLRLELFPWIGLGLIVGNRYPCFHRFQGGKGVANYLGYSVIVNPAMAVIAGFAWLVSWAIFRIPFIASFVLVGILGAGTIAACNYDLLAAAGTGSTVALIFFSHRQNVSELIRRQKNGE